MKKQWHILLQRKSIWIGLFTLFTLIVTFQAFNPSSVPDPGTQEIVYKDYNNYIIFKQSFEHLKSGQDLYAAYPNEYWDLYKYTPTFSVFFGLFSLFPDSIGLGLWNGLNALILVFAVFTLPKIEKKYKGLILLILAVEMVTSIQNEQSNGLMTGLIVLGYSFLEKRNYALATLLIVCSVYIKLFGIVAFALFLFYPKKGKLAAYTVLWMLVLFLVPLLMVDIEEYQYLWSRFGEMLMNDHSASYGFSVMGVMNAVSGMDINKSAVVLTGMLLLILPLIRFKQFANYRFRMLMLASILIWTVIFNHKAESPTFIIAMTGIGLWYVLSERKRWQTVMVIFAFIFTSLSATDVFPPVVREEFIKPYAIKAVPAIIVWCVVIFEMFRVNELTKLDAD